MLFNFYHLNDLKLDALDIPIRYFDVQGTYRTIKTNNIFLSYISYVIYHVSQGLQETKELSDLITHKPYRPQHRTKLRNL